ncbi:MAG: methyltransferase domain-containing protein [Acidobacteria bacterium]|nr:methyltransferase domain-containing protein [Acidobacteriota bacterium]
MRLDPVPPASLEEIYRRRESDDWKSRFYRICSPPELFIQNPKEQLDAPLGRCNLYIGGAGSIPAGDVNVDLYLFEGVDVAADAHQLPFPANLFLRIECDAVLEHVVCPFQVMREIERVLAPGGYASIATPFCHPFHEYPRVFHRFTLDGLRELAGGLEVVAAEWRTGPTATMLVFALEYFKMLLPWRAWRILVHGVLGWALFPLRSCCITSLEPPSGHDFSRADRLGQRRGFSPWGASWALSG